MGFLQAEGQDRMLLLLIRHGESEAGLLDVHEGRADFALTERGHAQAQAVAAFVKREYKVTRLYASPLRRAAQTAEYLAEATGVKVTCADDLMEFNNGLLAGMPRAEAAIKYPKISDLPADQAVYGQESKAAFCSRAERALAQILAGAAENDVIAAVTHGGMINQLYHTLLKLPVDSKVLFHTGDTGIHVWKILNGAAGIVTANLTGHTKGL